MKNFIKAILAVVMAAVMLFAVACNPSETLKGVTEDTILVGNTAGTTGALANIGEPFNLGIEAAFAAYNADGGFNGKQKVKLQHYDDAGNTSNAVTLMEKLIYEDEVFAIVGNFGAASITANLDIIKEAQVPMVYAASSIDALFADGAAEGDQRYIMPVQPWNVTEGRMMILRAFAPADKGGLAGTKVGVLSNTNEASKGMLNGIKAEAETMPENLKSNIVYQEVTGADFSAAMSKFKNDGCDVVVMALLQNDFTTALKAMKDGGYDAKVLTSYNNASTALITDPTIITAERPVYAQAWLDITSATYVYKTEGALWDAYKASVASTTYPTLYDNGVPGFNENYWAVAEDIFNYATEAGRSDAFLMSFNAYALAGYIAGDLFCQGLDELEANGTELTRENYLEAMERSEGYTLAMADTINFSNGTRLGVESFALTQFGVLGTQVTSATVHGLTTLEEYRALIAE